MILKNAAHQAVVRGHTVRFATASDMLSDLAAQESSPALARRLRRYTTPQLLCVDEVGYLSYDNRYADLLFEVVTRRYDAHKPLLLSTNKAFSEWSEVFPHAACVVTLVDRLIHRAEVIEIEAESYRLKEAKELNAARTNQRRSKR
jgi:DNA replication protein DnaC